MGILADILVHDRPYLETPFHRLLNAGHIQIEQLIIRLRDLGPFDCGNETPRAHIAFVAKDDKIFVVVFIGTGSIEMLLEARFREERNLTLRFLLRGHLFKVMSTSEAVALDPALAAQLLRTSAVSSLRLTRAPRRSGGVDEYQTLLPALQGNRALTSLDLSSKIKKTDGKGVSYCLEKKNYINVDLALGDEGVKLFVGVLGNLPALATLVLSSNFFFQIPSFGEKNPPTFFFLVRQLADVAGSIGRGEPAQGEQDPQHVGLIE